ncbi:N-acetyltransferase [Megavirus baoshan]|uniref:Putative N-acetyltransferase n=1 Tax=Megavirus baoshan TaxID=2496520 RepID=A0A3Q8U7K3_9VIRU|nr:N-acetyltransferase [Megavirus baoshan]AZL89162.1 N-acetyltransferase [Megavirus baoshan]
MSETSDNREETSECEPGKIMRKGYHRKGYQRHDYTRNGQYIPGSYVSSAYVPPRCVKDMGKPGRGKKTLPIPGGDIHLTQYGYSVHKSDKERQNALREASHDYGELAVLRRMNLIRNIQAVPENKEAMSRDVDYMSNLYAKLKKKHEDYMSRKSNSRKSNSRKSNSQRSKSQRSKSKSRKSGSKYSSRQNQRGGQNSDTSDTSDTSESTDYNMIVDKINLPQKEYMEEKSMFSQKRHCDETGCHVTNKIREQHTIDGREILYYTINKEDIDDILNLDRQYLDSDITRDQVISKINENKGYLIGIKVDGKLQGYYQYQQINDNQVKIIWFCANKGFGTPLYIFMEKYFELNNYNKIIISVSLEDKYNVNRLNFWYKMGFVADTNITGQKQIIMMKDI